MRAWGRMFGDFLARARRRPYADTDYFAHIDGKPRLDGVRAMLASRGIELPEGTTDDDPALETVAGLGNRKNAAFTAELAERRRDAVPRVGRASWRPRSRPGIAVAVVSSSRNAEPVLRAAGLRDRFAVVVDGAVAAAAGLPGKPAPDTYLHAAGLLGRHRGRVRGGGGRPLRRPGGAAGGFGLVVGVDRGAGALELLAAGADLVVDDLAELIPTACPRPRGTRVNRITSDPLDRSHLPVDEWALRRDRLRRRHQGRTETLFAVGNGYLGMRGNMEEGRDGHLHGTFINGFHETWPIRHAEEAYGFARVGQTIVNVPDAKVVRLYVDDEPLVVARPSCCVLARARLPRRRAGARARAGARRRASACGSVSRRMVSFTERHLAVDRVRGDAARRRRHDADLQPDPEPAGRGRRVHVGEAPPRSTRARPSGSASGCCSPRCTARTATRHVLGYRATNSGMTIAFGAEHAICDRVPVRPTPATLERRPRQAHLPGARPSRASRCA